MKIIQLTKGLTTKVDDEDYKTLSKHKWHAITPGHHHYAMRTVVDSATKERTPIMMHQQITGFNQTDHINRDGLDNRRANLRSANHQQNGRNSRKPVTRRGKKPASKYKGVKLDGNRRLTPWRAQIYLGPKCTYLGNYPTEEAAALVYNEAAEKHFGEFANLNEIRDE